MGRALWLLLALSACTEPRSARCSEICKREAECIEETGSKIPFEQKECIAACAALEQDAVNGAPRVKQHAACIQRQTSCTAVLECK